MGRVRQGIRVSMRLGAEGNPFEPDILTNGQWAGMHGGIGRSPERRLMVAVLENAVLALDMPWFESRDRAWPMSFENICDYLGLEPEPIRINMARRKAQQRPVILSVRRRQAGDRHSVEVA